MTEPDPLEEDTVLAERTRRAARRDPPPEDTVDGSTMVARRESRRRGERRASPPEPVAPVQPMPAERAATAPADTYRARAAAPVISARTPPPFTVPQAPVDGHGMASVRRRAGRRTALIVVVSASALAVIAAASLLLITLAPW